MIITAIGKEDQIYEQRENDDKKEISKNSEEQNKNNIDNMEFIDKDEEARLYEYHHKYIIIITSLSPYRHHCCQKKEHHLFKTPSSS